MTVVGAVQLKRIQETSCNMEVNQVHWLLNISSIIE